MNILRIPLLALLSIGACAAQSVAVYIESIAGNSPVDRAAPRDTPLIQPQAVWVHPNGDLYIADGNFVIRRVSGGISTIVAGGGAGVDDSVPIPARNANLDYPAGLVGTATDIYISDVRHHRIRRLAADGSVTTVVGRGTSGFSGDGGRGGFAELSFPNALAISPEGDLIIADTDNERIRRWNPRTQVITTLAGTGEYGATGDGGPALKAQLGEVRGLAYDSTGNLYLAQFLRNANGVLIDSRIRRIDRGGVITTYAGSGKPGFSGDGGGARSAQIQECFGLAVDAQGNLYIADTSNHRVRMVTPQGVISTYAGKGRPFNRGAENLPATQVSLHGPTGIALDSKGNLFIPEANADLVRRVDAQTKVITTAAGTLNPFDAPGPTGASRAPLSRPSSIATDSNGNIYIADNGHYRVRRIDRSGGITTVAGDGRQAGGDQDATVNSIGGDVAISFDAQGRLLLADRYLGKIRRVDGPGRLTTVLDMTAFTLPNDPELSAVVADTLGNLYVSDAANHMVYFYDGTKPVVLAGDGSGIPGDSGDTGLSTDAELDSPEGLALDNKGGLLICDTGNHRVRRVIISKLEINAFAGDGYNDSNFDGFDAVDASLESPHALLVDGDGYTYIADSAAQEIRFVDLKGIIHTLSGGGARGFAGDGTPAVLARFDTPLGLAGYGNDVYVCDSENYRVRRLFVRSIPNPLRVEPGQLTFRATQGGDDPSPQLIVLNSSVLGLNLSYTLGGSTDSGGAWLTALELEGDTPDVNLIYAATAGLEPATYTATIIASAPGSPDVRIPVTFTVDPPNVVSSVRLSSDLLQFTVPQSAADTKTIQLSSPGTTLNWNLRLVTPAPWLSFSPGSGATPSNVGVTADASTLAPGTYTAVGYFVAEGGGSTLFVVTLNVTDPRPVLTLDRETIVVEAVEGTTRIPTQTVGIYNTGSAPMSWELAIPADVAWLRASTAKGALAAGRSASTGISIDPSGLRAGLYQAQITLRADGAIASPRTVGVRLQVLPASTQAHPVVSRSALVFTGAPGAKIPEQQIEISSTGGALSFSASARGVTWLSLSPASGSVLSSADRFAEAFLVTTEKLKEGEYRGAVTYTFSDGSVQEVDVLLILKGGAATSTGRPNRKPARGAHAPGRPSADCGPTKQFILSPAVSNNFSYSVGWPVALRAQVVDDCGTPSTASTVTVNFNNGDPTLPLTNLRDGFYSGTWTPGSAAATVNLTFRALHPALGSVESKLSGKVGRGAAPPPVLYSGGVQNHASHRNDSLVAPGELLSLRGVNLPDSADAAAVVIGGQLAQVLSSTPEEMMVLAPASMDAQARASVVVTARGFSTAPESVSVVAADPGLYPLADGVSGAAGQALTVRATGIGIVSANGTAALPITAKLGDLDAVVAPTVKTTERPGVYELSITIPDGASGTMQLTITQNGTASNSIPVPLQ